MSKKEEILHKLSTEDRNYIKKKFKEREEFCIGQVESLTNLINVLIEENKELRVEIENLENANRGLCETLGMKDKDFYVVEKEEYDKMVSGAKQFANETAIKSLNKVHKFFSKTFVGVGLNTYCERVRPVESFIIEEIKKLKGSD